MTIQAEAVEEHGEQIAVQPLLLTYRQAGELLGLHELVVKALVKSGDLKAIHISPRVNRISRVECERFAESGSLR